MVPHLTIEDLNNIEHLLQPKFDEIKADVGVVKKRVDQVITILDGHTALLERHDQELTVLGAEQQKTTEVLVRKGMATPEELAVG